MKWSTMLMNSDSSTALPTGACPERLVELPREAPGTGELDQLELEVTAMIQQARCLGRTPH